MAGRQDKSDKTQKELKILSRSRVPKISLSFPSPYPSYFQHILHKKKKILFSQQLGSKFLFNPADTNWAWNVKNNEEFSHFVRQVLMVPFLLLTYLAEIPGIEMFMNNQIWAFEKVPQFNSLPDTHLRLTIKFPWLDKFPWICWTSAIHGNCGICGKSPQTYS